VIKKTNQRTVQAECVIILEWNYSAPQW